MAGDKLKIVDVELCPDDYDHQVYKHLPGANEILRSKGYKVKADKPKRPRTRYKPAKKHQIVIN